jgi:hypothetical protein
VRNPTFDRARISVQVTYTGNGNNGIESLTTPLPDTNTDGLY